MKQNDLGVRLRFLRKRRGWTLQELAEQVGITKGGLSQIERGDVLPGIDTLAKIADALAVSVGLLQEPALDLEKLPEISEILESLSRLPPEQIEAVRQIVVALAASRLSSAS